MTYRDKMLEIRELETEAARYAQELWAIRSEILDVEQQIVVDHPGKTRESLRGRLSRLLGTLRWRKLTSWTRRDLQMTPEFAGISDSTINVMLHHFANDLTIERVSIGHYRVSV